ncbi:MAG: large subunit ribosomal protein L9 [Verrucomicrobiales bacterium]|jgi:large subunit ribosomal protein L9
MATIDIILRDKITGLGAEADVVSVRRGYARNFLIPSGKAMEATRTNMTQLENLKRARADRESKEMDSAQSIAAKINKMRIKLTISLGQGGKAFGSITTQDLVKAISERAKGLVIDRHAIELDKPIKSTGKYEIPVKIHAEISAKLRVEVIPEEAEATA